MKQQRRRGETASQPFIPSSRQSVDWKLERCQFTSWALVLEQHTKRRLLTLISLSRVSGFKSKFKGVKILNFPPGIYKLILILLHSASWTWPKSWLLCHICFYFHLQKRAIKTGHLSLPSHCRRGSLISVCGWDTLVLCAAGRTLAGWTLWHVCSHETTINSLLHLVLMCGENCSAIQKV